VLIGRCRQTGFGRFLTGYSLCSLSQPHINVFIAYISELGPFIIPSQGMKSERLEMPLFNLD
jgi:hypothetical protein